MSRTGRKHSGTGIYHVMLRGINRQGVFEEPEDHWEDGIKNQSLRFCLVNSHMGLIPQKYKESNDKLGAIVNYVFQGVNTTKEQNITKISQQILKKVGRYDKETKKYRPLIEK